MLILVDFISFETFPIACCITLLCQNTGWLLLYTQTQTRDLEMK